MSWVVAARLSKKRQLVNWLLACWPEKRPLVNWLLAGQKQEGLLASWALGTGQNEEIGLICNVGRSPLGKLLAALLYLLRPCSRGCWPE
jgi:hypothetical protein